MEAEQLAGASAKGRNRPLQEALTAEVVPLAEACRFLERNAAAILKTHRFGRQGRPLWLGGVTSEVRRDPVGLVLIIGPGNYPLFLAGVQLLQALVAGNAVLLKPGIGGTEATNKLQELMLRAGLDASLMQVLPESVEAVQAAISAGPDKVVFTGSSEIGGKIAAQLADLMIPAVFELSGCDAVIVRADADVKLTVEALRFALCLNAGATCMAPKRLLADEKIHAEIEAALLEKLSRSESFPLKLAEPVRRLVREATAAGAKCIHGSEEQGPLVLSGVPADSPLWQTDTFGALLLIAPYREDADAIRTVNDCPFGLGASIFTRDASAARQVAGELQVGLVTVNDLIVSSADARLPFGGRRRSGYGSTRGAEGLLEMTTPKAVTVSSSRFRPAYREVSPRDLPMLLAYVRMSHGPGLLQRFTSIFSKTKFL
jgi:acyl-CoA reductase-like NAD-dependent aldehyde dehydrogenase